MQFHECMDGRQVSSSPMNCYRADMFSHNYTASVLCIRKRISFHDLTFPVRAMYRFNTTEATI